jgi:5'-nucleotidase
MVMPTHVAGLDFLDEARAINSYIPELKARGVRTIIVLLHQGGRQEAYEGATRPGDEVAGAIKRIVWRLDDEVDVVISGHTHSFTNALLKNERGKDILVTQSWSAGRGFADIRLMLNRQTKDVASKTASLVTAWADAGPGLTPYPQAAQLMQAAEQKVAPLTRRKIAVAAHDIARDHNPAGESSLGNLIADAQRQALGTDFALVNPGGIRTSISKGEVTWGRLYAVQPFNNRLVKMTLTGQQIYDLLNQQFPVGLTYHRMLQVSGLTYTWDSKLAPPARIVEVRKDGKPIDRTAAYTVTVNSYLAEGGDKFSVLTQGANQEMGPLDLEALCAYLSSLPQPISAKIEGRVKRLN